MDNRVIQAFKNEIGVDKVLQSLFLDFETKNEDAVLLCPFHEENTASFHINLENGMFHCFGCNISGGDIVHFIMEYKKLGFVQSLELLSELTGVKLPKDVEDIDKFELIQRKLIHMRQSYMADKIDIDYTPVYQFLLDLCSKEKAIEYLRGRGISNPEKVTEEMGIRIIDNYDRTNKALLERFSISRLMESGLMGEKRNLIFYSWKVLFPFIIDDEIIYLSGRTLENDVKPKYLNLIDRTIPNFYNVNSVLKSDTVVIAEGLTDTVTLEGLGIPAVGIAGASNIDTKTLEILSDKNVIIAFDNDKAGQEGQKKLINILQYIAKSVNIMELHKLANAKDLNEYLQNDVNKNLMKEYYDGIRTNYINR